MTTATRFVTVRGSWGQLKVHRSTGLVITYERNEEEDAEGGYQDIVRFDPVVFARYADEDSFDILGTAYWTAEGFYEPALTMRTATGVELHRGRVVHFEDDFDDWVPAALLEGPRVVIELSAFVEEELGQHHTLDHDEATGWCVLSVLHRKDGSSDVLGEVDFDSYELARGSADLAAMCLYTVVREY